MYEKNKVRGIVEEIILEYVPSETRECARERLETVLENNKMFDVEAFIGMQFLMVQQKLITRSEALKRIMCELRKSYVAQD